MSEAALTPSLVRMLALVGLAAAGLISFAPEANAICGRKSCVVGDDWSIPSTPSPPVSSPPRGTYSPPAQQWYCEAHASNGAWGWGRSDSQDTARSLAMSECRARGPSCSMRSCVLGGSPRAASSRPRLAPTPRAARQPARTRARLSTPKRPSRTQETRTPALTAPVEPQVTPLSRAVQLRDEAARLRRLGRLDEAMAQVERAMILKPGDSGLENEAGLISLQANRLRAASMHFQNSLKYGRALEARERETLVNNYVTALSEIVTGQLRSEIDDGKGGRARNPDYNPAQAVELCREALRHRDNDVRLLGYLGVALSQTGAPIEALYYFEKAYDEANKRADDKAISARDRAQIRANVVTALSGIAWEVKGNSAESLKHMAKAYEIAQQAPETARDYGRLLAYQATRHADQKNFQAANTYFRTAMELVGANKLDDAQASAVKKAFAAAKIAESVNQPENFRHKLLTEARALDPALHEARGLSGGMTWVPSLFASDLPKRTDPDWQKKVQDMSVHLAKGGIDATHRKLLSNYDFVLGLAVSREAFADLGRVRRDEFSAGRASRASQEEYDKMRGKTFGALDCHSNGAMICLAALANGDIEAKSIRLLGPQITAESLKEWNQLLKDHKGGLTKLEILVNVGDPVPYVSATVGGWSVDQMVSARSQAPGETYALGDMFDGAKLEKFIQHNAPDAAVSIRNECRLDMLAESGIGAGMFNSIVHCHDIGKYSQ